MIPSSCFLYYYTQCNSICKIAFFHYINRKNQSIFFELSIETICLIPKRIYSGKNLERNSKNILMNTRSCELEAMNCRPKKSGPHRENPKDTMPVYGSTRSRLRRCMKALKHSSPPVRTSSGKPFYDTRRSRQIKRKRYLSTRITVSHHRAAAQSGGAHEYDTLCPRCLQAAAGNNSKLA